MEHKKVLIRPSPSRRCHINILLQIVTHWGTKADVVPPTESSRQGLAEPAPNCNASAPHLPTQNGCVFTFAKPKRQRLRRGRPFSLPSRPSRLHTCRTKTATASHLPTHDGTETATASHLPTQNGCVSHRHSNGSGFTIADPKRMCLPVSYTHLTLPTILRV